MRQRLPGKDCVACTPMRLNRLFQGVPRIIPAYSQRHFKLFGLEIMPLTVMHGPLPVTAFRLGNFAYVTDCK